jgi:hypothetical protein
VGATRGYATVHDLSGAAGTTALNVASGIDAVIRGRPASEAPQQVVAALADRTGVSVPGGTRERGNRLAALGPLAGTATGVLLGAGAGVLRAAGLWLPAPRGRCAPGRGRDGGERRPGRRPAAGRPAPLECRRLGRRRRPAPGLRADHARGDRHVDPGGAGRAAASTDADTGARRGAGCRHRGPQLGGPRYAVVHLRRPGPRGVCRGAGGRGGPAGQDPGRPAAHRRARHRLACRPRCHLGGVRRPTHWPARSAWCPRSVLRCWGCGCVPPPQTGSAPTRPVPWSRTSWPAYWPGQGVRRGPAPARLAAVASG